MSRADRRYFYLRSQIKIPAVCSALRRARMPAIVLISSPQYSGPYMIHRFATVITQEGRWYVTRAVELGVTSQGRNISEALENLKEAADLFLETIHSQKSLSQKCSFADNA